MNSPMPSWICSRAAPGLRPRRGSQHPARGDDNGLAAQRRDFGPGEDHNLYLGGGVMVEGTVQRRDFGPGEAGIGGTPGRDPARRR